jgi:hypothetical protein
VILLVSNKKTNLSNIHRSYQVCDYIFCAKQKKLNKQIVSVKHAMEEFYAYRYQIHWIQTEQKKTRFKYEITDIRKQKYRKKDMEI